MQKEKTHQWKEARGALEFLGTQLGLGSESQKGFLEERKPEMEKPKAEPGGRGFNHSLFSLQQLPAAPTNLTPAPRTYNQLPDLEGLKKSPIC